MNVLYEGSEDYMPMGGCEETYDGVDCEAYQECDCDAYYDTPTCAGWDQ